MVLLITDLRKTGYLALCLQLPDKKQEHCCIIDIIGWLERNARQFLRGKHSAWCVVTNFGEVLVPLCDITKG